MSLHVRQTTTERTEFGGRCKDVCACGWEGAWHDSNGANMIGHNKAKEDYRQHVEDVLGASAYYSAAVGCKNCGSRHEQPVLVGTAVSQCVCLGCGQTMLTPDNDVWHEETERTKRFRL